MEAFYSLFLVIVMIKETKGISYNCKNKRGKQISLMNTPFSKNLSSMPSREVSHQQASPIPSPSSLTKFFILWPYQKKSIHLLIGFLKVEFQKNTFSAF